MILAANGIGGIIALSFYKLFYESDMKKEIDAVLFEESEQEVKF